MIFCRAMLKRAAAAGNNSPMTLRSLGKCGGQFRCLSSSSSSSHDTDSKDEDKGGPLFSKEQWHGIGVSALTLGFLASVIAYYKATKPPLGSKSVRYNGQTIE